MQILHLLILLKLMDMAVGSEVGAIPSMHWARNILEQVVRSITHGSSSRTLSYSHQYRQFWSSPNLHFFA